MIIVGTSAWLNIIFITIIVLAIVLIICKFYKNFTGKDILEVSEYLGGKTLEKIVSIMFFVLFIYIAVFILRNFCDSLQKTFLPNTPLTYIMLFLLVGMILSNRFGFAAIIKINTVIIGIVLVSILIIFIAPINSFDVSNLFPIFGKGISTTFLSGLTNICIFSGIAYLYFLMPFLEKPQDFKKIASISVIISGMYLFLSTIIMLGLFSYLTSTEDIFSLLLITRVINLGAVFERVDAIFLLVWILALLAYLSFVLYFALYNYKHFTNISNQNGMIYSISALIFGLSLLPKNTIELNYLQNNILKGIIITILFAVPLIIYVLAHLKYERKHKIAKKGVKFDI